MKKGPMLRAAAGAAGGGGGHVGPTEIALLTKEAHGADTSFTTTSADFVAGALYLLAFGTGSDSTVTGIAGTSGLTWTVVDTQLNGGAGNELHLYWAIPDEDVTGTIVVSFDDTESGTSYVVELLVENLDTTTPIAQSKKATFDAGTANPKVTLDAGITEMAVGFQYTSNNTPGTTGTETSNTELGNGVAPNGLSCTYSDVDAVTVIGLTKASSTFQVTIAVEIDKV